MASSSSANDSGDHYDVFLSFRGEDTRYNFTSHLYNALCRNNIKAFIDYRIDRGDEITPALKRVIEGAKISIIVFSKRYAESAFCLEELVRIMECKKSESQIVLPIFHKVDPLEVAYQEAFARHENNTKWEKRRRGETIKQDRKKVERWKSAFLEALELAGWHIVENSDEAEIIGKITKEVSKRLNNNIPKGDELMCTSMIGQTVEDNFKEIWECLMDNKISRVGLYGMGGIGKTTIATRINDQLLATVNSFSHVFWVTVSKVLSICNMQNKIAKMIKLDLSNEDDDRKRAAKLRKKLKNEKFVLILDDVWKAFEIEDVGIPPFVDGQKLIMTSRSRRVCKRMECVPIAVKPLSEKDALNLFVKESKYQVCDPLQWEDIVDSIVKECGGLPLAIVVVARRMRGVKETWRWRNILRELQKPSEGENSEIEEKVFQVLKLSYDCLPNDKYRQCFLYCSLFPEDHLFERDELIEYWIGEGLVDGVESTYEELDKSNCILDELMHASLLENVGEIFETIKMHDIIRDMARMNVKVGLQLESVLVLKGWKNFSNSVPHCSKLKTLVLKECDLQEPCFFANMQFLHVLHIKSMYGVKSIPNSITKLGNLKVLIINCCDYLECIPSLAGLGNLRRLKISWNGNLEEIPKGIDRLVNLRVLDLSWNVSLIRSFSCGVVEKLSHLQILNLIGTRVEVELKALFSLKKLHTLIISFFNLQKLNCYLRSGHWRRLVDYQICYGKSYSKNFGKGMSFDAVRDVEEWKGESGMFVPDNIQYLELKDWESPMFNVLKNTTFTHLKTVRIYKYKSRYLFTIDLAQRLLHNVQQLEIGDWGNYESDGSHEIKEIIGREGEWMNQNIYINYPTIILPNLKKLRLIYLRELRSIYRGRMVCLSLELIEIFECDKLERLPFCMEKPGKEQNPTIKLGGMSEYFPLSRRWWDSLQWDDPNTKSMYNPIF